MGRLKKKDRLKIATLYQLGWSPSRIMKHVKVSYKTYKKWRNCSEEELDDSNRRLNCTKLSAQKIRAIYNLITVKHWSLRRVSEKYGVSHETMRRYVYSFSSKENPLHPYKLNKIVYLSDYQRKKRIEFYGYHLKENWKMVCQHVVIF